MPVRFAYHTIFCTLLFCLVAKPNRVFSQPPSTFPAFYPIAEHSYSIKEGLPDVNVEKVFLDKVGRLHINTSGGTGTAFGRPLYEFNGIRAYPSGFEVKDNIHGIKLEGKDSRGPALWDYDLFR